jgi:uncharacterized membrane protein HdeD (DUF308 family)
MVQDDIPGAMSRIWWGLLLRGIIALALGVFVLARPLESVAAFALVIAIWALVDGITSIVHAFDLRPLMRHWWLVLIGGIISAAFGILALYDYPMLSLTFAVIWLTWWLLASGVVAVYAGFQQQRLGLPWGSTLFVGLLSIVAGVVGLMYPPATLGAIMGLIAGFAIFVGIILLIGAFKLKSAHQDVKRAVGGMAAT